jgi:hypothetical protein
MEHGINKNYAHNLFLSEPGFQPQSFIFAHKPVNQLCQACPQNLGTLNKLGFSVYNNWRNLLKLEDNEFRRDNFLTKMAAPDQTKLLK